MMATLAGVLYTVPTQKSRLMSANPPYSGPSNSTSKKNSQKNFETGLTGQSRLRRKLMKQNRPATRFPTSTIAALGSPRTFMANEQEDEVTRVLNDGGSGNIVSSSSEFLDTVNAVVADIVDGQKYLKETGRTKPRPMKRRALVVCLALGVFRPLANDVESRVTNMRRTSSSSFARTCHLVAQISFGASRAATNNYIADQKHSSETNFEDSTELHLDSQVDQNLIQPLGSTLP